MFNILKSTTITALTASTMLGALSFPETAQVQAHSVCVQEWLWGGCASWDNHTHISPPPQRRTHMYRVHNRTDKRFSIYVRVPNESKRRRIRIESGNYATIVGYPNSDVRFDVDARKTNNFETFTLRPSSSDYYIVRNGRWRELQ